MNKINSILYKYKKLFDNNNIGIKGPINESDFIQLKENNSLLSDYCHYDEDIEIEDLKTNNIYIIWENYKNSMNKRRPDSHLYLCNFYNYITQVASVFRYKDSYIIGTFDNGFFKPSHFSPATLREGLESIEELCKYNNIIFTVTSDLTNMLKKMGAYTDASFSFPMIFRNQIVLKNIVTTNKKVLEVVLKKMRANEFEELYRLNFEDIDNSDYNDDDKYEKYMKNYDKYGSFLESIIKEEINKLIKESTTDIEAIKNHPFIKDIERNGGAVYYVGGFVRDSFLNKESKDIDMLITGIPMDKLEKILSNNGKVDVVGKSFGVLKFIPNGSDLDLDIAIPRKEKSTGEKYTDFEVVADHNLSIEDDLSRRDFSFNAIAKDIHGNIVDPFNGRKDLQNKLIRMVNPIAFSEDPLRMLRAIQFSARFNFTIEKDTFNEIKKNASKIKSITPERILIEFDKIVKKGNIENGIENLINTRLYENIFNTKPNINKDIEISNIKTMGEFIFTLCYGSSIKNISDFYKNKLKGGINSTKEIKALEEIYNKFNNNRLNNLITLFNTYTIYPEVLNSDIFDNNIKRYVEEFKNYPKTIKELDIDGNDIMNLGYKGAEIREVFFNIIKAIFENKINNNNKEIINYIQNEKDR
jgi:tRNA nucleotidyltransferase/poly(A) polymerase